MLSPCKKKLAFLLLTLLSCSWLVSVVCQEKGERKLVKTLVKKRVPISRVIAAQKEAAENGKVKTYDSIVDLRRKTIAQVQRVGVRGRPQQGGAANGYLGGARVLMENKPCSWALRACRYTIDNIHVHCAVLLHH